MHYKLFCTFALENVKTIFYMDDSYPANHLSITG